MGTSAETALTFRLGTWLRSQPMDLVNLSFDWGEWERLYYRLTSWNPVMMRRCTALLVGREFTDLIRSGLVANGPGTLWWRSIMRRDTHFW